MAAVDEAAEDERLAASSDVSELTAEVSEVSSADESEVGVLVEDEDDDDEVPSMPLMVAWWLGGSELATTRLLDRSTQTASGRIKRDEGE